MACETDGVTTSVIIPVYNDPEGLETTVDSLLDQTVEDYEIIIADNGSTDCTREVAGAYSNLDVVTHVIEDEIQSSYAARNAGIRASQGDLLCFIDADMWVNSMWLEDVQRRVEDNDINYLGCRVEVVVTDDTVFAEYQAEGAFPIEQHIHEDNFASTCCLVVRRGVIDEVGLFDSRLISGGDAEFGLRVHRAGYDQVYAEDIVMYHPARSSLSSILKKEYRIARGRVQRDRYYPEMFPLEKEPFHPRHFLPIRPHLLYESHDGSFKDFLVVYTIRTGKKIAAGVGRAVEFLFPTRTHR